MYMGKLGNCKAHQETPATAVDHDQVIVTAEGVLRYALVCVAAVTLLVGVWSYSFRKMVAVYFVSMVLVGGVVLPDWDYFDRDWKEWCTPMPGVQSGNPIIPSRPFRFRLYPLRLILYSTIYSFSLYKLWMYIVS